MKKEKKKKQNKYGSYYDGPVIPSGLTPEELEEEIRKEEERCAEMTDWEMI